jgi:hypothetical protein
MNSLRQLQITLIVTLSTAAIFIWGIEFFLSVNERQAVENTEKSQYSSNAFAEVNIRQDNGEEEVAITLDVTNASQNIRGAEVSMRYESEDLELVEVIQGDFFTHYTENQAEADGGILKVGGVLIGNEYKREGNYFKLIFKKLNNNKSTVSLDRSDSYVVDVLGDRAKFTGELSIEIN